jgi:DNA-binding CsgD family transcriptional regulator
MDLLERERPLAALDGWLRDAAAGEGRLVLVGGEAGIGKTALIDRFCATARGRARLLRGACDVLSTPRPLGPLQDIAAATGGELDRLLSEGAPRDRVFRAALAELGGGLIPVLAVVEDAHWADEATFDLLRFLGRRLDAARALLLVTYRDDEVGPKHPLRLVLGDLATTGTVRRLGLVPLSVDGIRSLAAAWPGGARLDPAALHRMTGGNPFFASEVLADESATVGGIPATVRDAVLARASRLPPAARAVLEAAAAIGPPIGADLLIGVARATAAAIEACLSGGMLVALGDHAFAFRHELARAAVYDAISSPRRRDLHARVLAALQDAPGSKRDLARLAHHAEAADDEEAVLRFALAAARQAASLRAHREAAAQYERVLRFAADLPAPERARLDEAYAYECYLTDQHAAGIAARRRAVAIWRAEDRPVKVGENLRWISRHSWFVGQGEEAARAAHEAVAVLATTDSRRELAWAYSNLAQLLKLGAENQAAVEWAERAIALAEEAGEQEVIVHALNNLGTALEAEGEPRGRSHLERSLRLALELGLEEHVARGLMNLTSGAIGNFEFAAANRYVNDGIAYATEHDLDAWRCFLTACRAAVRLYLGDWNAAADDAIAMASRPSVSPVTRMVALEILGRLKARRGDPDAVNALNEALALAAPRDEVQYLGPIHAARAEAGDLAGDRRRTAVEVRAIEDRAALGSPRSLRGELAYWRWRAGEFVGDPGTVPGPYGLQVLGDWQRAAASWDDLGCPYEAARARTENGDETALRAALATFEQLEARPMAALTARRLRELGARVIPRGPRPTTRANPANLTARELEILPLLAARKTNTEIAERLFLSPKTVQHHVGSIFAKLGVHARGEIPAAADRLGLPLSDLDVLSDPVR